MKRPKYIYRFRYLRPNRKGTKMLKRTEILVANSKAEAKTAAKRVAKLFGGKFVKLLSEKRMTWSDK